MALAIFRACGWPRWSGGTRDEDCDRAHAEICGSNLGRLCAADRDTGTSNRRRSPNRGAVAARVGKTAIDELIG
jgi:hypothetical protein